MIIYTVMGSTDRIEWASKSFTCEEQAKEFRHLCDSCARRINTVYELLRHSPDPKLHDNKIHYQLRECRIRYEVHSNELVTDAFMELTLQQHKPKLPFKDFL